MRVNGRLGGDISSTPVEHATIEVEISDADEPEAEYVLEAFSGVVGGALVSVVATARTKGNGLATVSGVSLSEKGQFVFLKLTQLGRVPDRVWSAPVWLDLPEPAATPAD